MTVARRIGAGVAIAVVSAAAAVQIAGSRLPEAHTARLSARFESPPEDVWRAVTDLEHLPQWRSDVESVELSRMEDGRPAWTELDGWGERTAYEVVEARFPDHFVTRIADETLPYGGTWTWRFESAGSGARVTITEDGFVRPAAMRAIAAYGVGHDATMRAVLSDLAARFGQDLVLEE